MLIEFARKLKSGVRQGDGVFRWGGEEFVVVLPHTSVDSAKLVIERLYQGGFGNKPNGDEVMASMGLAEVISDHCYHWKCLAEKADERLYHAKNTGRGRCIGQLKQILVQK